MYLCLFIQIRKLRQKANYLKTKHGLLTVIECIAESNGSNNGGVWLCKCKCGGTITLSGYNLSWRDSCGCLVKKAAKERGKLSRKPDREKELTGNYQKYKRHCKYEKVEIVSKNEWISIISHPCVLCGGNELREDLSLCKKCYSLVKSLGSEELIAHIQKVLSYSSQQIVAE